MQEATYFQALLQTWSLAIFFFYLTFNKNVTKTFDDIQKNVTKLWINVVNIFYNIYQMLRILLKFFYDIFKL